MLGYAKMIALQGSMPNICAVSSGMSNICATSTAHLGSFSSLCATPCSRSLSLLLLIIDSILAYTCITCSNVRVSATTYFSKAIDLCKLIASLAISRIMLSRNTLRVLPIVRTFVTCNKIQCSQRSEEYYTRATGRTVQRPYRQARDVVVPWTGGDANFAVEWIAIKERCLIAI